MASFKLAAKTGVVAALVLAAGLGFTSSAMAETVLKFAHIQSEATPFHQAALMAAKAIGERTEGRYRVEVYPNSSLGTDEAIIEGLGLGTVDIIYSGPAFMAQAYSPIGISDYPFVFRNLDHWKAYWKSDVFAELAKAYEDITGNVHVASAYYGARQITANKPILSPDDMKGLKIRVAGAPAYMLFPQTVGANPTPMAFAEVYLGLSQGVVDAQENPLLTIQSAQFYEVQSDISLTSHVYASVNTLLSGIANSKFSDEDRAIIFEELNNAADWCTGQVITKEAELVAFFEEKGIHIHEVDRQPFIDLVAPALKKPGMPWSPELFERIEAIGR